jgi:predicted proteasome-type protease
MADSVAGAVYDRAHFVISGRMRGHRPRLQLVAAQGEKHEKTKETNPAQRHDGCRSVDREH